MSNWSNEPAHPDNNDAMVTTYDENEADGGEDIYGAGGDSDSTIPPEDVKGMEDFDGGYPPVEIQGGPAVGGD